MIAKFGETSADAIILRKQGDEKLRVSEIRRHPELPESDDLVQYLILDTSKEVDEEEEIMEQLYSAADESSSSSSSSSSKTSKKKVHWFNISQCHLFGVVIIQVFCHMPHGIFCRFRCLELSQFKLSISLSSGLQE